MNTKTVHKRTRDLLFLYTDQAVQDELLILTDLNLLEHEQ
jgi:hypothetical protein